MQISAMVSTLLGGMITEPLGRKKSLILGQMIILSGWSMLYFAGHFWVLMAGRLVMGVGVGFVYPVTCMYLSEIALVRYQFFSKKMWFFDDLICRFVFVVQCQ